MKTLKEYIINETEQHINEAKEMPAESIKGPLTAVQNYMGYGEVVVGKPFTNDRDETYIVAQELLKKLNISLVKDLEKAYSILGEDAGEVEHWVISVNNDGEANVEPYGQEFEGVFVPRK